MRSACPNDHPKSVKKIIIDRNICIGAASCAAIASKAFKMDGNNKVILQDSWTQEEQGVLIAAAKSCPVDAIILLDEDGKQIWPPTLAKKVII